MYKTRLAAIAASLLPSTIAGAGDVSSGWCIKETTPGCYSRDDYEHLNSLKFDGDLHAYGKQLLAYGDAGKCRTLWTGTPITIESAGTNPCVRPQGETRCLFVPMSVVATLC
jgi:hypothetical protein